MDQEKVGLFIKNIRIKNNLTQKQLADKLNVTYQAVSKWERGLNVPDIAIMMEISKLFNVDITEIISGEENKIKMKKKKNNKKIYYILLTISTIIILIFTLYLIFKHNNDTNFEFKKISSDCDNFELTGSAAYNKEKSSIYISNVTYCGLANNTIYDELECDLYEDNKLIRTCEVGKFLTLEEYLKDVKISVNNYKSICNNLLDSNLYLEIRAKDKFDKITTYNIPINLDDNCDTQP